MIKNIIFDFGGVVLKHKPSLISDILSEMFPDRHQDAVAIWQKNKLSLNNGRKTSNEFIVELKNSLPTKDDINTLKNKWSDSYKSKATVDYDLLQFVKELKKKYHIYLFSDTIDIHDEYNKTRGIYEEFHKVFKSYNEGVCKIEGKKAFENLIRKLRTKPEECLFIDDLPNNIAIANELGMKGIVYKNLQQLKTDLSLLGI